MTIEQVNDTLETISSTFGSFYLDFNKVLESDRWTIVLMDVLDEDGNEMAFIGESAIESLNKALEYTEYCRVIEQDATRNLANGDENETE